MNKFYTVKDISAMLNISCSTVRNYIRSGIIDGFLFDGKYLIERWTFNKQRNKL